MQTGLYVALSAQLSLQRRLDTIANNVANSSTAGFRAEEVKFSSLLSQTAREPVAFASTGESFLSRKSGEVVRTDGPLDVAVGGDAWLAVESPGSGRVYTRDGRMQMTETGELRTLTGGAVLDVGGAPIQLDATAGAPVIAHDGTITQGGRQVGAIGLFSIDPQAKLTRADNAGVIPDRPAQPVIDFAKTGMHQGYIERANVDPVMEITRLISVSRAFDAITNSLNESETSLRDALKTLGSGS